jgi:hypothetical protein
MPKAGLLSVDGICLESKLLRPKGQSFMPRDIKLLLHRLPNGNASTVSHRGFHGSKSKDTSKNFYHKRIFIQAGSSSSLKNEVSASRRF